MQPRPSARGQADELLRLPGEIALHTATRSDPPNLHSFLLPMAEPCGLDLVAGPAQ